MASWKKSENPKRSALCPLKALSITLRRREVLRKIVAKGRPIGPDKVWEQRNVHIVSDEMESKRRWRGALAEEEVKVVEEMVVEEMVVKEEEMVVEEEVLTRTRARDLRLDLPL